MSYVSITDEDRTAMLNTIGVNHIDDLFEDIPASIRINGSLDLPEKLSELEITRTLNEIAGKNSPVITFCGAGSYNHYIPAVVDHLSSRSEFYTAYTPYQAEVSQGTLSAIFEYQTLISRLTGMDFANASLYDGATALAESVLMSIRSNRKNKIVISKAVHPHYREVLKTYSWAGDNEIIEADFSEGVTTPELIDSLMDDSISCIITQSPNFFGIIEDLQALSDIAHDYKANHIVVIPEPMSLGILKNPGNLGADIVCGEGQGFGNPIGFGGPLLGFMSAKSAFMRKMPGRLIGKTVDSGGDEAFILTLQAREQHIRRDRATSNICTNQGLCALRAVIYLSTIGNKLKDIAELNHRLASHLRNGLLKKGFEPVFEKPYFNEFTVKIKNAKKLIEDMSTKGFAAGVYLADYYDDLKDTILFCVTEVNSVNQIDDFLKSL